MRAAARLGSAKSPIEAACRKTRDRCRIDRAPSEHREVVLVTIRMSKEYDAGLVVLSRRAEQLAGQCNGRIEDFAKCFDTGGAILIRSPQQCGRGSWRKSAKPTSFSQCF
jgi:hypothetical protein